MEALFLKLVNMSITASYLVIAVMILRLILPRAPRWIHASLWTLVGLRLALPFSFKSFFSLIPSAEPLPEEFLYAATPKIQTGIPAVNNSLNPIIAETLAPDPLTSANPTQILSVVFAHIWLIGLVFMLIYAMVSFAVIRRKVGPSMPVGNQIRLCDSIDTPFILGIFRPRIYLPSSLDEETAAHVLAHERAHLTRKDHWWKPLGYLMLCVYWFNPLMWAAYILLCRDIEMACDEKVIRDMDPLRKKAYSAALLQCSLPRHLIAACPLAFGEVGVKQRIKSVLNYKKPAFWVIVTAVIASIVVAVCFLTDPVKATPFPITSTLKTEEVEWVQVTLWKDKTQHIELSNEETKELVSILNTLQEDDFVQSKVPEHNVTLMIYCGEKEILLHFDGDYVRFIFDSGTAGSIDDEWCYVSSDALNAFITAVCQIPADRLAVGDYVTAELVYWPIYSSQLPPTDVVYRYTVSENAFYYPNGTVAAKIYWQWRRAADCADELKFYLDWYDSIGEILDVPNVADSDKYQMLDKTHHLLLIDDELYLVEGHDTGKALENVTTIYRLEADTGADIPVYYPDSTIEGHENHLYSTYSGQIYDVRSAQDMLIRNAILESNPMSGSVSFESHQILSEMVGCGAEETDGGPTGFTVVDVIAVVMHASLNEKTIPDNDENFQIINATITYERYADGTLKRTEYQLNEIGNLSDYDLTPLYQQCYDQAVKYWGLDTRLVVDSLLDTISASPAQYSFAGPYIEAHREEYDRLIHLGIYTLNDCFDAFVNNRASGIRAEIMAAVCRDIAGTMGENIDFEGQYVNGPTWFAAFHANAMELYEANGLDALEETNPVSWLLLNMIGQTPDPVPGGIMADIFDSEHFSNAISLHVDVKFPENIDVGAIKEIPTPESVLLDYTSDRGDRSISPTSSITELVDEQTNMIHYHFIFELYEREPTNNHFTLTMSGFPEVSSAETVTLNWQADVDDARVFTAESGDSDVKLTISPYLVNVEFTNPDYDTLSGLYDSIQIWDTDGRLLPVQGPYGGGEGKYRMTLSVTLLEPLDIDSIETVKVGGLILKEP